MGGRNWLAPVTLLTPVTLLALLAAGCGADQPDRDDVVAELADDTIAPTFAELDRAATSLATATARLCAAPTIDEAGIAEATTFLATVRSVWSRSEVMWVGPVMERRSWAAIDWPIASAEIEDLIADTEGGLDADYLGTRIGADQRGLGAVEYLLAGEPSALTDPRRCRYLVGVAEVIAVEAALVADDWTTARLGENGLDSLINDSLFLLEAMADIELGRAIGLMEGDADTEAIVEGPAGLGVDDLAAHLQGVRAVLIGDGTNGGADGIGPLLGQELTERLITELDAADAAVLAIDGPLLVAIEDDPNAVAAARDAIKAVQITVATEVVSRLGVTIGFSDADGDTGA